MTMMMMMLPLLPVPVRSCGELEYELAAGGGATPGHQTKESDMQEYSAIWPDPLAAATPCRVSQ